MRLDAYLAPRTEGGPSGENLEYDPAFTSMLLAAAPGQERQAGDEIVAAEDPDFKQVQEKALAVLERSHDLRAAIYLAQAQLRLGGFEGLAGVTDYLRGCLQDHWETCHPQLDPDDDNDPTMRITTMLGLAEQDTMLRPLRLVPLTESQSFGRFSLRDVAIAEGEIAAPPDMVTVPDLPSINAAFKDTKPDVLRARLEAARAALADVSAINAVFDDRTPGEGPNLDPLIKMLKRIVARLALAVGVPAETVADSGGAEGDAVAVAGVTGGGGGVPGTISSQADVEAALGRIITYYRTHEPSSPLPLLLERARRLVGADFMTILEDIAPAGIENARLIGGIPE